MIEKKICGLFVATILLVGPLLGVIPAALADDEPKGPELTKLQKICAKERSPEKIKPECELLNLINEFREQQEAKNAALMAKDDQLMDKDVQLMAKDDQLMDKDVELMAKDDQLMAKDMLLMTTDGNLGSDLAAVQADANTACATIPVVKTGFGLVTGSTVIALDAFNVGIDVFNVGLGLFNAALMDALGLFNVGINLANLAVAEFNFAILFFNGALDGTFNDVDDLVADLVAGLNLFQILDVLDVIPDIPNIPDIPSIPDIPGIPDIPTIPISGMPVVPDLALIDTTLIDVADDAVQDLALCT